MMDGQPPTPPLRTSAGPGAGRPGCPWEVGMQVLRLLAARLSWRPPRSLISLRRCPGFRPCRLCRVSRSASRDSPYARLSRPRLVPRAAGRGSGRVGVERHPLGHARFRAWEPGTLDTWDAQSPQRPRPRGAAGEDETAASCPSVKGDRKIGEAAGGGGGAQLGSAGRGVPWQPGFCHPSRYLPTPPPPPLWCTLVPMYWVPGMER